MRKESIDPHTSNSMQSNIFWLIVTSVLSDCWSQMSISCGPLAWHNRHPTTAHYKNLTCKSIIWIATEWWLIANFGMSLYVWAENWNDVRWLRVTTMVQYNPHLLELMSINDMPAYAFRSAVQITAKHLKTESELRDKQLKQYSLHRLTIVHPRRSHSIHSLRNYSSA